MAQVAVCSQTNTKHKYSVGRAYSCWILNLLVHHVTSRFYKVTSSHNTFILIQTANNLTYSVHRIVHCEDMKQRLKTRHLENRLSLFRWTAQIALCPLLECNNYSNSIPNGLAPANDSVTQGSVIYTSWNNATNRDFAISHRTLLCTLCFGSSETGLGEGERFCACSSSYSF